MQKKPPLILNPQISIRARVPGNFARKLKIIAVKRGVSVTYIIKAALYEWMQANSPEDAPSKPPSEGPEHSW